MEPICILLAEDNPDHLRLLRRALGGGNRKTIITEARSEQELLKAAAEQQFDCVILDYNLGDAQAVSVIPKLAEILPHAPVIVTSASEEQDIVIASLRIGVTDFIRKDEAIRDGNLRTRINNALRTVRERREERRRLNRRLVEIKRRAETDPLTGLFNRRFADRILDPDRSRSDRRSPHACIMIDIDHFKAVNDTHGHDAGDAVIRHLAELIKSRLDPADVAIRWGGEEFVVIKASCSLARAAVWAHALRLELNRSVVHTENAAIPVTASFGVTAAALPRLDRCLISRADQALYLAKDSGRNAVCTTSELDLVNTAQDLQTNIPDSAPLCPISALASHANPTQAEAVHAHGRTVAALADEVAHELGFAHDEIATLRTAARYHDVGKLAIPEEILAAPRALSEPERALINTHSAIGAQILAALNYPQAVVHLVRHHHDRYDAPPAAELPPRTRDLLHVLSACDAAAAMLADRPYSNPKPPAEVAATIRDERNRCFAPAVVEPLCAALPQIAHAA